MLRSDPSLIRIIYPSWAKLGNAWDNLDALLADPSLNEKLFPREDWGQFGFPDTPHPYSLLAGPNGGGIISLAETPTRRSAAAVLLSQNADIRPALVPTPRSEGYNTGVFYLEPRDGRLLIIPFVPKVFRRRAETHRCRVNAKPVPSAGHARYWLIRTRAGRRDGVVSGAVVALARGFGLDAEPCPTVPDSVRDEAAAWLVEEDELYAAEPGLEHRWFAIGGGSDLLPDHAAILAYVGFDLRWKFGPQISSAHLLARIDP